jgi:hypothetical protein
VIPLIASLPRRRSNSWIVATLVCAILAASPGLAASRQPPHAHQPAAHGAEPGGNASAAKPVAGEATPSFGPSASKMTSKRPIDQGGKTAGSKPVGPIDLTRPDDGYADLRRRAIGPSLVAAEKKLRTLPPAGAGVALHPPAAATPNYLRNATGAMVPAGPTQLGFGLARREPSQAAPTNTFGSTKNSLGLSPTAVHPAPVHVATPAPPVIGINGTSLHPAGGGIGGPAKDRSAIPGSSYRHK